MRILVIGGNGTIGRKVAGRLSVSHEVIIAGRHSAEIIVDLEKEDSIREMFKKNGKFGAIVACVGGVKWEKFDNLTEEDFYEGIRRKLMGQVNLVRIGKDWVTPGGSITLTTGILGDEPQFKTTIAAMVNGALHSFVKAVTLELDNIRVNVVCPDVVEDSWGELKSYFPGHMPVSMNRVTDGYIRSIEGKVRGEIIRINS